MLLFIVMSFFSVGRFLFERSKSSDFSTPANDSLPSPNTRYLDARKCLMVTFKSPIMVGSVLSMDDDGSENVTKKLNSDEV